MNSAVRQPILGVNFSAVSLHSAVDQVVAWVRESHRTYVCVAPAHSIMDCVDDPSLYPLFNDSGMITPDGMAVVWLLQAYGHRNVTRVYGPDLMLALCGTPGLRHFFYGGAEGVAEQLVVQLEKRFPGIAVAGTFTPPFRELSEDEQASIVTQINDSHADIVWVGISTPKQERWMAQMRSLLTAPVLIGVGAAFDFHSGRKQQAPRWIQRSGLEWLFRFLHEPRRLWPRYRKYPRFVYLVIREFLRRR